MYGYPRPRGQLASAATDGDVPNAVVADLERHTGPQAEQEDDITLVTVRRTSSARSSAEVFDPDRPMMRLAEFQVPSLEGNERIAIDKLAAAIHGLDMESRQVERLKTAVGETVMNAMEHGNRFDPDLEVTVSVQASDYSVFVRVSDHGEAIALDGAEDPDLEAKLAGEQTPRGWGLFLIGQMVDQVNSVNGDGLHTVELVMHRKERPDARP
jgi:anti-sigma regulatory factor (Ser/Thr protein kinase)